MKLMRMLFVVLVAASMYACSSSEDKAYKAQREVSEERLELIDKYQECIEDAQGNKDREASCEHYLKAAEALK